MIIWSFAKHAFMMFWYPYVGMLNRLWPSITVGGKKLVIFPGVYKPLENEHACADYCRPGDKVLDLGCGSGVGALFCAPKARELLADNKDRQFATSKRYLPVLFSQVRQYMARDGLLVIQYPIWFRGLIGRMAAEHGMKVLEVRRMPLKSPSLLLLSLAYMQFGFRSAFYLLQQTPASQAETLNLTADMRTDARKAPEYAL